MSSNKTDTRDLSVYLGKTAINETDADKEQSFTVDKLIIHKDYDDFYINNDIGVHNCTVCMRTNGKIKGCGGASCAGLIAVFVFKFLALLKIKSRNGGCAVKSASARVVCLPPLHTQLPAGFQCSIAGFGLESYSTYCRIADLQIHN